MKNTSIDDFFKSIQEPEGEAPNFDTIWENAEHQYQRKRFNRKRLMITAAASVAMLAIAVQVFYHADLNLVSDTPNATLISDFESPTNGMMHHFDDEENILNWTSPTISLMENIEE